MRKIIILASCIALAACSEAGAPEGDAVAVEDTADATYAGGAGTYTRTGADGVTTVTVVSEDMTYASTVDGQQTSAGTVAVDGNNACFDDTASDDPPACWVNMPMRADGTFESANPAGETFIIQMTPPAAAATAAPIAAPTAE